jgi:hypothetical protein
MNPLELQVLSIVCGVAGAQNAPTADASVSRQPAIVVLPAQQLPAPGRNPQHSPRPPASR